MEEEEEYTDVLLNRYKNLKMFKGKTEDEIRAYLKNRPQKEQSDTPVATAKPVDPEATSNPDYDKDFKSKLRTLQREYGVDMNDANDAESLRSLVRFVLQLEAIDKQIRELYASKSLNPKAIKDLGDYQRSLQMSIMNLQEQLGISRKSRKEDKIDDLPKAVANLQDRAKKFLTSKTVEVRCPTDQTMLVQLWVNFPKLKNVIEMELTCWKCNKVVLYGRE